MAAPKQGWLPLSRDGCLLARTEASVSEVSLPPSEDSASYEDGCL